MGEYVLLGETKPNVYHDYDSVRAKSLEEAKRIFKKRHSYLDLSRLYKRMIIVNFSGSKMVYYDGKWR